MEPKLRFPEFNSNWTHDNLENVAEIFDGTHQTPLYTKTGVQFVSVENIEDIYKSEKYISHEEYDKYKNKPQINDILMTRITAGVIGETAMVTKDVPLAYYVSLALIRCEKLFPSYVEKYIHSIQFRKELYKRIIHTAFPKKINLGDIGKCLVGITNEQEQQKIAEFLSTIDTVIEKQKETVSAWEERKKGVIQKLFSQEVRFKADDGSEFPEWEKKRIGDVCEQTKETIDPMDKPKNLFVDYSMPAYDNEMKPDIAYGNTMNSIRKVIRRPCVLINKLNVRKRRIWNVTNPENNAVCSAEFVPLTSDVMNLTFVTYFALTDWFTKYLLDCSTGSSNSQKRVTPDVILNVKMPVPCLVEQQKIADCLSSLDEVIEKQKAALAAWEELKKGLLQQMFV